MDGVPVPEALRRWTENPGFWLAGRTPTPDDRELRVPFPVAGGYGLVLDLAAGETSLGLREPPTSEPVQLGSAAPGSPPPAALRWWELDLCARVIALDDPTLPHPGLVVALLSPFAPATADDDAAAIAAVRKAAYRSLRRTLPQTTRPQTTRPQTTVPQTGPIGPEQPPLPLFASADWWPDPPAESPQILDEAAITALITPAAAHLEVRGGSRFPRQGIQELVRHAADRLSRHPRDTCYAGTRPLARHIVGTGDLQGVPRLLSALTEAGCDHPTVLDALSEPLVPIEACWMVETLAGAHPGTLLRHHV
jgi:hypothetical protein